MHSMTGYGRMLTETEGRSLTVEVKSVNHRFLDLSFRMPRALQFAEEYLRKTLGKYAHRGHFDISVTYANRREDARVVEVDEALLKAYHQAVGCMKRLLPGVPNDFTLKDYAALPEVLHLTAQEEDRELLQSQLGEALTGAMAQLCSMREAEGKHLAQDLSLKLDALEALHLEIAGLSGRVVEACRARLTERLEELLGQQAEEQRVAQELVLFADRCAIDEELVRLESHIAQMREALRSTEPVGRRLDFIVQELNREVNTIGSKSQDADITARVIDAKTLIEKMREQVQNVE